MHSFRSAAFGLLGLLCATIAITQTHANAQENAGEPKVQAELVSSVEAIVPGQPFEIGLRQSIEPNWHTYWKNPGDSGEPTRISWILPDGFSASEIAWPLPDAIPVGPLKNYGYSDRVLLPVVITPPKHLSGNQVTLTADATWLVCEKICIPESAKLSITMPVATDQSNAKPSQFAPDFDAARRGLPLPADWPVSAEIGDHLSLIIDTADLDAERIARVEFFPSKWGLIDHAAPQVAEWRDSGLTLKLKPGDLVRGTARQEIVGVLAVTERIENGTVRHGFQLSTRIRSPGSDGASTSVQNAFAGFTFWHALLFAVLGGIILNAMPCVLPILSLKVMSLAQHSGGSAARGGLAYLIGVLVSFACLACLIIFLKSVGTQIGWGFQFQSPAFVLAMIALFFALGLSMSGVFDIGGNVVGAGEALTRRAGPSGSFFTGMLATIAATPCTAPFMGVAVGYAVTQSSFETFAVLMALGLGFAAPIVLLAWTDAARRILPRPGPWMETLKQALAFPLYATVAWLAWVLAVQTGSDGVLAAGMVLTAIGLSAWIIGQPMGTLRLRTSISAAIILGAILLLPGLTKVDGRAPVEQAAAGVDKEGAEQFSLDAVARHRSNGRPVFVNLTAAWCISCKVNERIALSTDGFRAALKQHDIAYLKGDWTNRNDEIAAVLRSFGRAGVPLYLLYPANTSAKPVMLPQILTEAIVTRHFASLSGTTNGPQSAGE